MKPKIYIDLFTRSAHPTFSFAYDRHHSIASGIFITDHNKLPILSNFPSCPVYNLLSISPITLTISVTIYQSPLHGLVKPSFGYILKFSF